MTGTLLEDFGVGPFSRVRLEDGSESRVICPLLSLNGPDLTPKKLVAGTRLSLKYDSYEDAYWAMAVLPGETK